jgi:predicted 2-oxoglutarate/Fe(II)-dependent dioxygenase YbiX
VPRAEFFARLGLFIRPHFLSAEECARFREEASAAAAKPATVAELHGYEGIDETTRRTRVSEISTGTRAVVTARLEAVQPELERHFQVSAAGWSRPQFLVYQIGDFFKAHPDVSAEPGMPDYAQKRRLSAVVFLSDESDQVGPGFHTGGALTFYGLLDHPRLRNHGLPLVAEAGLLIVFRPEVVHEVTPVTHGCRHSIVTWLTD